MLTLAWRPWRQVEPQALNFQGIGHLVGEADHRHTPARHGDGIDLVCLEGHDPVLERGVQLRARGGAQHDAAVHEHEIDGLDGR